MFGWVWGAVDAGLAVAERVDRWLDRRKERKREREAQQPKGLTFQEVQHIERQIRAGTSHGVVYGPRKLSARPPPLPSSSRPPPPGKGH